MHHRRDGSKEERNCSNQFRLIRTVPRENIRQAALCHRLLLSSWSSPPRRRTATRRFNMTIGDSLLLLVCVHLLRVCTGNGREGCFPTRIRHCRSPPLSSAESTTAAARFPCPCPSPIHCSCRPSVFCCGDHNCTLKLAIRFPTRHWPQQSRRNQSVFPARADRSLREECIERSVGLHGI
jgi:hypothetical protein